MEHWLLKMTASLLSVSGASTFLASQVRLGFKPWASAFLSSSEKWANNELLKERQLTHEDHLIQWLAHKKFKENIAGAEQLLSKEELLLDRWSWRLGYVTYSLVALGALLQLCTSVSPWGTLRNELPWWLTVKNLPVTWETQAQTLGWEDPLEEEMATYSSILAWKSHGQRSLACCSSGGHKDSDTT